MITSSAFPGFAGFTPRGFLGRGSAGDPPPPEPSAAPAVVQRISVVGDSWTECSASVISRPTALGGPLNTDAWPYLVAQAMSPAVPYYTLGVFAGGAAATPSAGNPDAIINVGYGGATSSRIWHNLNSIIAGDAGRGLDTFTWWGGRNEVAKPGGAVWPEVTTGDYTTTTAATLTSGSTAVTGVTLPGDLNGCAVSGTGIPAGATIIASTTTTLTLSVAATISGATTLTISARGAAQFLSLIPHSRKLILAPYGGIGASSGSNPSNNAAWVRAKRVIWDYRRTKRAHHFEHRRWWMGLAPFGSDGTAAENTLVAGEGVPASQFLSEGGSDDHPNYLAQPLLQAGLQGALEACQNKRVWVLDQTIPDVRYDLAAGQTVEVYFKGYVTACSIATDDANVPGLFTIAMKPGSNDTALLTRTSVSPGNIPRVIHLVVQADGFDTAGAARTHQGNVRILPTRVGAASTLPIGYTMPRDPNATTTSRRYPFRAAGASPFPANRRQCTIVFRGKVGEDATGMTILSILTNRVLLQRSTANRLVVNLRDTANVVILNWTSTTAATFNIAAGEFTAMFSIDMDTATAHLWANIGGADVDIAVALAAPTVSGPTQYIDMTGPANWFANTYTAQVTFQGSEQVFWMSDTYFDFSNSAERRKFVGATGALVDLGADGSATTGVVPEFYFGGAHGDFWMGKNFGSGGDVAVNDPWLSGITPSLFELTPY